MQIRLNKFTLKRLRAFQKAWQDRCPLGSPTNISNLAIQSGLNALNARMTLAEAASDKGLTPYTEEELHRSKSNAKGNRKCS